MNDDPLLWEPYDRHWIRLRGPWTVTWLDPVSDLEEPQPVTLPVSWQELFGARVGRARFERRFQRPTNLEDHERVVVTLRDVGCEVSVRLNESHITPLAEPPGDPECVPEGTLHCFDVTSLLLPSNRLEMDLNISQRHLSGPPCGLWQPVLLEVITLD